MYEQAATQLSVQMSEAEQQFVNTSQRVRKEFEAKLEEVRRAGEEDVHLRMDAGTKRIMQQNRSLQEELHIHIEVITPPDVQLPRFLASNPLSPGGLVCHPP